MQSLDACLGRGQLRLDLQPHIALLLPSLIHRPTQRLIRQLNNPHNRLTRLLPNFYVLFSFQYSINGSCSAQGLL
jgi:hypothetical protein